MSDDVKKFKSLVKAKFREKFSSGSAEAFDLMNRELDLICYSDLAAKKILKVYDFVNQIKQNDVLLIPSISNDCLLTYYLLGLTFINPLKFGIEMDLELEKIKGSDIMFNYKSDKKVVNINGESINLEDYEIICEEDDGLWSAINISYSKDVERIKMNLDKILDKYKDKYVNKSFGIYDFIDENCNKEFLNNHRKSIISEWAGTGENFKKYRETMIIESTDIINTIGTIFCFNNCDKLDGKYMNVIFSRDRLYRYLTQNGINKNNVLFVVGNLSCFDYKGSRNYEREKFKEKYDKLKKIVKKASSDDELVETLEKARRSLKEKSIIWSIYYKELQLLN